MYDLAIQIVNYKTKKYLTDCLRSVFEDLRDAEFSYQVNVLDNASGDDLSDLEIEYSGRVHFFRGDKNVGFGAGHNLLARKTQAKYLLLLNPDIKIIEPDTVGRLLKGIKKFDAQVIGPRLITAKGKVQWWDHGELHGFLAQIALNGGGSWWKPRRKPVEVAWVSGAVFLIEKNWFDRINGFDENFFLHIEEEDLSWRLREQGGRIIYEPTITVFHHGGASGGDRGYYRRVSGDYYIDKHLRKRFGYRFCKFLNKVVRR